MGWKAIFINWHEGYKCFHLKMRMYNIYMNTALKSRFKLVNRSFHTQTKGCFHVFEELSEGGGIRKILISLRGQN